MTFNITNSLNNAATSGGGGGGDVTKAYVDAQDLTKLSKQQDINDAGKPLMISADGTIQADNIQSNNIDVDITDFQILTGSTIQLSLEDIDTKLALNENYDSILLSLDPLNDLIGGSTDVPLGSLQTQLIDGRPSHKEAGALVYDEFGTIGILDHITDQTAYVTTLTGRGSASNPIETYNIQKNGLDQFYIPVGSEEIRADIAKNKLVRLSFEDTITNTGEQIYDFETFDKQNYAVFRRNVIADDIAERINIKVNYQGIVTFERVQFNGILYWSGNSTEYKGIDKKENIIYKLTDTNEVFLGTIKLSM